MNTSLQPLDGNSPSYSNSHVLNRPQMNLENYQGTLAYHKENSWTTSHFHNTNAEIPSHTAPSNDPTFESYSQPSHPNTPPYHHQPESYGTSDASTWSKHNNLYASQRTYPQQYPHYYQSQLPYHQPIHYQQASYPLHPLYYPPEYSNMELTYFMPPPQSLYPQNPYYYQSVPPAQPIKPLVYRYNSSHLSAYPYSVPNSLHVPLASSQNTNKQEESTPPVDSNIDNLPSPPYPPAPGIPSQTSSYDPSNTITTPRGYPEITLYDPLSAHHENFYFPYQAPYQLPVNFHNSPPLSNYYSTLATSMPPTSKINYPHNPFNHYPPIAPQHMAYYVSNSMLRSPYPNYAFSSQPNSFSDAHTASSIPLSTHSNTGNSVGDGLPLTYTITDNPHYNYPSVSHSKYYTHPNEASSFGPLGIEAENSQSNSDIQNNSRVSPSRPSHLELPPNSMGPITQFPQSNIHIYPRDDPCETTLNISPPTPHTQSPAMYIPPQPVKEDFLEQEKSSFTMNPQECIPVCGPNYSHLDSETPNTASSTIEPLALTAVSGSSAKLNIDPCSNALLSTSSADITQPVNQMMSSNVTQEMKTNSFYNQNNTNDFASFHGSSELSTLNSNFMTHDIHNKNVLDKHYLFTNKSHEPRNLYKNHNIDSNKSHFNSTWNSSFGYIDDNQNFSATKVFPKHLKFDNSKKLKNNSGFPKHETEYSKTSATLARLPILREQSEKSSQNQFQYNNKEHKLSSNTYDQRGSPQSINTPHKPMKGKKDKTTENLPKNNTQTKRIRQNTKPPYPKNQLDSNPNRSFENEKPLDKNIRNSQAM